MLAWALVRCWVALDGVVPVKSRHAGAAAFFCMGMGTVWNVYPAKHPEVLGCTAFVCMFSVAVEGRRETERMGCEGGARVCRRIHPV